MRKLLFLFCFIICLEPNFGFQDENINDDLFSKNQYFLVKNHENIKVYNKIKPKRGYIEYKASIILFNIKICEVIDFFMDYSNHHHWVYNCLKSQLLKKDGNTFLYQVIKSQWPFKKRDYILQLQHKKINEDCIVMIFSSRPSFLPETREHVRIREFESQWIVKKERSYVKILVYSSFDPEVPMSTFLMKNYSKTIPLKTLVNLEQLLLASK